MLFQSIQGTEYGMIENIFTYRKLDFAIIFNYQHTSEMHGLVHIENTSSCVRTIVPVEVLSRPSVIAKDVDELWFL